MTQEEKAKRYDEALEAIKSLQEVNPSALEFVIESLDNMFTAIGYMDNYTKPHLEEILGALKKLMEE
jgi:hypothetical protein